MSTIGSIFRVTTFGESHGVAVGCVIDGCPSGVALSIETLQKQVDRRRPGKSSLASQRNELDKIEILSGVLQLDGHSLVTLGTPICIIARNADVRSIDYENTRFTPRPGHADYTYQKKYSVRAGSGGGRASARETIARVAAGAVAEAVIQKEFPGMRITAWVSSVGNVKLPESVSHEFESQPPTREDVDGIGSLDGGRIATGCPHGETAVLIAEEISRCKSLGDSIGGTIDCVVTGLPPGLGEPVFDKITAVLAQAMMSIPATRGFEIGRGFKATAMQGSEHNDVFSKLESGALRTSSNNAGGTLGGISSGMPLVFRVAFKPVSSIGIEQHTCDFKGEMQTLEVKGRHDPCVLPRCPPIVEGMTAIVICDLLLKQKRHLVTDWGAN